MRIAIIGAGFSGCQLTLELLRRARPGTQILLFDRSGTFGPGVAFRSTAQPVPAEHSGRQHESVRR
jgi:uncharacterized NAD(P)/FAD-binding protein YdhS